MDKLIAQGKAEPMLVVMEFGQSGGDFGRILIEETIPMIDSKYRTVADSRHRAMAGLSMGAMQTKAITMANPDVFSALGIFSGGVISVEEAAQAKGFREAYKLVFISFGSREVETPRYGHDPKVVTEELKASGMNAHYYVSPETAHEWQTWRRSLYQFAQLLFK